MYCESSAESGYKLGGKGYVVGTFFAISTAMYVSSVLRQKLPEHTRIALEQFAKMAVQQVEQQSGTLSGPAKKQLAVVAVSKLLSAFGLPDIAPEAVDIAIEAAVLLLPTHTNNPPVIVESPKLSG